VRDPQAPSGLFDRWLNALFGGTSPANDTPRWRSAVSRVLAWVPVVLVLALPVAALVLYFQVGWRADDLAEKSSASLAQGDFRMALLQAESAHRLRGSNPEVARARAAALTAVLDPRAVEAWNSIAAGGGMTPAETRARAEATVQLAEDEEFDHLVSELEDDGNGAEAARWRGWRARLRLEHAAAEQHLRDALAREPTDSRRLDLARLLAEAGEAGAMAQAAALVDAAGEGGDGNELLAFGLQSLPGAGAATRHEWARRALARKTPDNSALLPAASALVDGGHAAPGEMAESLQPVFAGRAPAERAAYARWLTLQGMTDQALGFATLDDARTSRPAFLARAEALTAAADWAGLLQLVETPSPAGEVAVAVLRARAERGLGRGAAADLSARRALALAAPRGQLPETIAQLEAEGQAAVADAALLDLCGDPRHADFALRVARWRYGQRGEPRLLDEALRRATAVSPQAPSVLDLQRRIRLLGGEAVDPSETAAAWSVEPPNLDLRLTHALALLRSGRALEARALLVSVEPLGRRLPPGQRAILAAVQFAAGAAVEARELARTIPPGQLTDLEYALVYEIAAGSPGNAN